MAEEATIQSSTNNGEELIFDIPPLIRVYKDGRVERLNGTTTVPAGTHPIYGVKSKDVTGDGITSRIYLPKSAYSSSSGKKLPLLVYFHGGGFCIESAFSPTYQNYLDALVAEADVVAVSVDYRKAPEHPVPVPFEDCWTAVKWVAGRTEPWIRDHADVERVFLAGDSAGANITHNIALRIGMAENPLPIKLQGIVLIHPYFWGEEAMGNESQEMRDLVGQLWRLACPGSSGCDDPLINPAKEAMVGRLGCERVLVAVAGKDGLRDRGWYYKEVLEKSGWRGTVEMDEAREEEHVFHLQKPESENAAKLLTKVAAFLNAN